MRVLTMNVWGVRGDWPARRAALHAELEALDPDVLSLQETIVTDDYDQVTDLLGGSRHVAHQQAREPDGQGVSIASRWPISAVRELDGRLGPRTGFAATTLLADIDTPDGPLLLVNHFPSWRPALEAERCRQALAAARMIETMRPDPNAAVVLAGDLDADPDADSVRFWTGRAALEGTSVCYRDAWASARPGEAGATYTPDNPLMVDGDWPFRRIDYVLVRCDGGGHPVRFVRSCRLVGDAPRDGVWLSDHFGLVADLSARV